MEWLPLPNKTNKTTPIVLLPKPTSTPLKPDTWQKSNITKNWLFKFGPLLVLGLVVLVWGLSLPAINPRHMDDLGLLRIFPLSIYAALAVLLISFGFMVYRLETHPSILMLYVIVLIFIIHGTPTLVYGTLRYSWAWKHIGIIDYIERFGTVDPNINVLNAYHNWPGFFTLNAFITQAAGLEDPLRIAMWAPVFFNLIDLGALLLIFTSFTKDKTLIWLAIFIYYLTSWVGQDYYSPQALNYFLHLVILGVALRWARLAVPPSPRKLKRWFRFNWVAIVIYKFLRRSNRGQLLTTDSPPLNRLTIVTIVILLGGTIASSHQITPFMTIMALAALVIFQRIKERSLPIIMIVLTFGWLMFGATAFMRHEVTEIITSFGQITENVDSNLRDTSEASPGQQLVSKMGRGLTLLTWGLAFLGGGRRFRWGYWDLSIALLAVAPFMILAGNSYGGEAIFRVYLFSLPFMAFFVAALLRPHPRLSASFLTFMITILICGTLLTGFLFAYFGKEQQYYFTPQEVEAGAFLQNIAKPNSLLIEGSRNYPSRFHNYEYFTYVAISREPDDSLMNVVNQPIKTLSRWMDNPDYTAAYLIITRSQKMEVDSLGEMPLGSLDKIEQALTRSPQFQVIFENQDAKIFTLADQIDNIKP
ncbi:MAG: hypothetical protein H6632_04805 [Anaerolineales bacterium]|nr:hypothetical protein [Anaerolineales bacterium]